MIPQVDPVGRIYTAPGGVPLYWNAGVGYDAAGRMCTTTVLGPNDQYLGGWRLDPVGRVVVAASLDSQIAALFAAGEQGVWYDPSDMSTMFQDTAGTVPVTAIGQQVARINDKSGRGNFAIQATAASRPLLQQDGAGKWYLAFDGVDDGLQTAPFDFGAVAQLMAVAGARKNSDVAQGMLAEFGTSVSAAVTRFTIAAPAPAGNNYHFDFFSAAGPSNTRNATPFGAPITNVVTGLFDYTQASIATQLQVRVNGVVPTLTAGGSVLPASTFAGALPLNIGRRNATNLPLNGRIYGLIIRGAASDAAQIASGEAWCNSKAGAY
jgi:hypothetical protein